MIELPSGWRRISLADLGDWFGGGTPAKHRTEFWKKGTVPWLSPKDMGHEVIHSTQDHITDAAVAGSSVRRVPEGSVALVVRSGILERTLPIAVVPFEVTLNQDMKALLPRSDVDARWIAWGLRSREQELLRRCRKSGTTVASIETKELMAQELPVPPLDQQRRIVEVLEDHLSRLDATGRGLATAAHRLDQMRVSGLMAAFQVGEHGGVRRVMPFGASQLAVPEGWEHSTVGAMSEVVEYGSGAKAEPESAPGRVPVLRMGNVKGGALVWDSLKYLPESHPDVARLRLLPGDLLFNSTNSAEHVGKSAVFQGERDATFASYLIRVRFGSAVNPMWASRVINSPLGRQFVSSVVSQQVGQANVNGSKLRAFPLPVPPRAEQDAIVAGLTELDDAAGRLKAQLEIAGARSGALRRSLLGAAFSGRLA